MFNLLIKTAAIYFILIFAVRIMGKRQIAQMQAYDLVVALMIAEAATTPLDNPETPLFHGILPALTLILLYYFVAKLSLKSQKLNQLFEGTPSVIIKDGMISKDALAAANYNLYDLTEAMRIKGYDDISQISCAILETSGDLSVFPKNIDSSKNNKAGETNGFSLSLPLVIDGKLQKSNMHILNVDELDLKSALEAAGITKLKQAFFVSLYDKDKLFIQYAGGRQKRVSLTGREARQ